MTFGLIKNRSSEGHYLCPSLFYQKRKAIPAFAKKQITKMRPTPDYRGHVWSKLFWLWLTLRRGCGILLLAYVLACLSLKVQLSTSGLSSFTHSLTHSFIMSLLPFLMHCLFWADAPQECFISSGLLASHLPFKVLTASCLPLTCPVALCKACRQLHIEFFRNVEPIKGIAEVFSSLYRQNSSNVHSLISSLNGERCHDIPQFHFDKKRTSSYI